MTNKYSLSIIIGLILIITCSGCLSDNSAAINNNSDNQSIDVQPTNLSNDTQGIDVSANDTMISPDNSSEIDVANNTSNVTDTVNANANKILAWRRAHSSSTSVVTMSSGSSSDSSSSDSSSNVAVNTDSPTSTDNTSTVIDPSTNNTDVHPNIPADVNWSVTSDVVDVENRGISGVYRPGDVISYVVNVTNTGNSTLTNLVATDTATLSSDTGTTRGTLALGETWTLHGTYTASINDMIGNDMIGHDNISLTTTITCNELGSQQKVDVIPIVCQYTSYKPNAPPEEAQYAGVTQYSPDSYYVGGDGHRITLLVNKSAVNPTFAQLVEFIKADKTNEIPYNLSSFVCGDYAELVQNNAEMAGYRCAWVSVDFTGESSSTDTATGIVKVGHACNLFNTTDRGLIGVDCTQGTFTSTVNISLDMWDSEVSLAKGGQYQQNLLYSFPNSELITSTSVGTIAAFFPFRDSQTNDI